MDETRTLVVDLAGRLREGDRLLSEEPATLARTGDTGRGWAKRYSVTGSVDIPLADCHWRETLMEAHARQAEVR